jgi:hypothetical protein
MPLPGFQRYGVHSCHGCRHPERPPAQPGSQARRTSDRLSQCHWRAGSRSPMPRRVYPLTNRGVLRRCGTRICLALVGGAVAEQIIRDKLLYITKSGPMAVTFMLAALTWAGHLTPTSIISPHIIHPTTPLTSSTQWRVLVYREIDVPFGWIWRWVAHKKIV